MRKENNRDIVIFSLPGSISFSCIESGAGDDKFIVQAFLKEQKSLEIKGSIKPILEHDIRQILSGLELTTSDLANQTQETDYQESVRSAISEIQNNVFEKVVLAAQSWELGSFNLADVLFKLRVKNPLAFVYAFGVNQIVMLGASPEKLLVNANGALETEALGGTLLNGTYSQKEIIEHAQICDYIESILKNKGYEYTISDREVKDAGFIQHLSSQIKINKKHFGADLKLAIDLHPTSAVCGLPFEPAINFIRNIETIERNYYSGFLGFMKGDSEFQFYVNLRCAEFYSNGVKVFAGAGINKMSDPRSEWEEVNNKMQTIVSCLK